MAANVNLSSYLQLYIQWFCCSCNAAWSRSSMPLVENGSTDDRSASGPSAAILLHNASQLLITSVSLPLNSPTSTCNGCTAIFALQHQNTEVFYHSIRFRCGASSN